MTNKSNGASNGGYLCFRAAPGQWRTPQRAAAFHSRKRGDHVMSGTTDKIKGRVKEAVGVVTDNQRLKDEGRTDQAIGKVKKAVGRVLDKAKR
jgi:uncharacterized protein YjbJ (UPF0337 family)